MCLANLSTILKRCKEVNLILSWEKSHFMLREGIVLRYEVFKKGFRVYKAKVYLISNLLGPSFVK